MTVDGGAPVTIVPVDEASSWNDYVAAHPKGAIFHTAEMVDVFRATPKHEPLAIAAVDHAQRILALLVAVRIETVSGFASSLASRSVFYAEPLCNDTDHGIVALRRLIEEHDRVMSRRTLFAEVRPLRESGAERVALESHGHEHLDYLNYVVDLDCGEESLWRALSKSARKKIRRSERLGVDVRIENSSEGIECMYELVRTSYARSNVPLAAVGMFHEALRALPKNCVDVRIAWHNDTPVAGGIVLKYKKAIFAWYGGSERVAGIVPFDCLTWDEICWGANNGYATYDFGGAGWPDEEYGPREFKAKFGGDRICYGRYRKVYSPFKLRLVETAYRTARRFISLAGSSAADAKGGASRGMRAVSK